MISVEKIRGPVVPILTIFKDDLSLDLDGVRSNVRHLIDSGFGQRAGVMLAVGAGGEFPSLSTDERKLVAEAVVDEAGGSSPVFIGVQHTDPRVALELARHAESIGADGIQVSPPYYYHPTEEDVLDFFSTISDSIDLPIMVYNTYWEGFNISVDFLAKILEIRNVKCVKWSSPTFYEYKRGLREFAGKVPMIDNTASPLASHVLGARGFISHESNFWPRHELDLWERLENGEYLQAFEMLRRLNWPFYDFRVKTSACKGGEAHVIKAAMDLAGLKGGRCRPPTRDLDEEEREELKSILSSAGLEV